jgi:serine/threonine-protein kinase
MSASFDPSLLTPGMIAAGRYEVVRRISAGGMGAIYEVKQLGVGRRRAMKVMLPHVVADAKLRARFEAEARVTAEIRSEHLVEILDADVDAATGLPFIIMELLDGHDLGEAVARRGRLSPTEVVTLLGQAASALDRTHAAGIVHRDLKPENLFLTARDDGTAKLKVLDFGIAKVAAQGAQAAGVTGVIGTPYYMSPEQALGDGRMGPAVDVYALGHIAFTLLVGHPYWLAEAQMLGNEVALLARSLMGAPEPPSARALRSGATLPAGFDAWFARATAREPTARFGTAGELVTALRDVFPALSGGRAAPGSHPTERMPVAVTPVRLSSSDSEPSSADLVSGVTRLRANTLADHVNSAPRVKTTTGVVTDTEIAGVPTRGRSGVGIAVGVTLTFAALGLGGLYAWRAATPAAELDPTPLLPDRTTNAAVSAVANVPTADAPVVTASEAEASDPPAPATQQPSAHPAGSPPPAARRPATPKPPAAASAAVKPTAAPSATAKSKYTID